MLGAFLTILLLLGTDSTAIPRSPRHGEVYVVAHRGAHQSIPENTLAAYAEAIRLGADFVEIDLRTTGDGHLVSIHNSTVDAYAKDAHGPVRDFTLAELKALDIGSRVDLKFRAERVPTFTEILELCKGKVGIYLDLKDADVARTLAVIRAYGMESDVLWYAPPRRLAEVRKQCPECIPMPDPGPERLLDRVLKDAPQVVASVWEFLTLRFVERVHAAGAIVIVDEDTPDCWREAVSWKVDGIQTDHPERLIAFLGDVAKEARAE